MKINYIMSKIFIIGDTHLGLGFPNSLDKWFKVHRQYFSEFLMPLMRKELGPDDIVVHCKMGGRSAKACDILRANGFKSVKNTLGGILAWSDKVDPSVPKY